MLINGICFNSEAWHSVSKDDVKSIEKVDECLLRSLLQSHPKAPLEFLYLETGSLPISLILASRRLMYLRTILMREDEELIKRVYRKQQSQTTPGDFSEMVMEDFMRIGLVYDEARITSGGTHYQIEIRKHIRNAAFSELKAKQIGHSKVKHINYEQFEKQHYLTSPLFSNEDVSTLSNLRSHTTRGIRANFQNLYKNDTSCPLKCWPSGAPQVQDTQQHLLFCEKLEIDQNTTVATDVVKYDDIYRNGTQQKVAAATLFPQLLACRNKLLYK